VEGVVEVPFEEAIAAIREHGAFTPSPQEGRMDESPWNWVEGPEAPRKPSGRYRVMLELICHAENCNSVVAQMVDHPESVRLVAWRPVPPIDKGTQVGPRPVRGSGFRRRPLWAWRLERVPSTDPENIFSLEDCRVVDHGPSWFSDLHIMQRVGFYREDGRNTMLLENSPRAGQMGETAVPSKPKPSSASSLQPPEDG
jgi:hypothetical protein